MDTFLAEDMDGSINTMSQGLLLPGWPGASVDNGPRECRLRPCTGAQGEVTGVSW